ncbi:MAG: hypothetical protein ACI4UN_01495 [Muribaculaceae bacterium]
MQTVRNRIRRDYAPLNVSLSVKNYTPNSPMAQVYNPETKEYEPNREITPLVLVPVLSVNTSDGSLTKDYGNADMAIPTWYVNGVKLSESAYKDTITMETEASDMRGALTVRQNVKPGMQLELYMVSELYDARTGNILHIQSDVIILATIEKSEDSYTIALGDAAAQAYNPLRDMKKLVDYKKSHGIAILDAEQKEATSGVNTYIRRIDFKIWRGQKPIWDSKYVLKLYSMTDSGLGDLLATTDGVNNTDEVVEFDKTHLTIDLRFVESVNYAIMVCVGRTDYNGNSYYKQVALHTFGIKRHLPAVKPQMVNLCNIAATDVYHSNQIIFPGHKGKALDYPGAFFTTRWKTQVNGGTEVERGQGHAVRIKLADTGIGKEAANSYMDLWAEIEYDGVHSKLTDSEGNQLTANGEILIGLT